MAYIYKLQRHRIADREHLRLTVREPVDRETRELFKTIKWVTGALEELDMPPRDIRKIERRAFRRLMERMIELGNPDADDDEPVMPPRRPLSPATRR